MPSSVSPSRLLTTASARSSRSPLASLLAGAALAACAAPPDPSPPAHPPDVEETLANLVAAGFPASDLQVKDGAVYAGRDALVSLAASREMLAPLPGSTREQYRTTNLVAEWVRDVCVDGTALTGTLSTALNDAIYNYNAIAIRKQLRRITSSDPTCHAVITAFLVSGEGGVSGFPSGGMPYPFMFIGAGNAALGLDVSEHVIAHELGHIFGLRHSDFYNRAISCGGLPEDEGQDTVGAILIPDTPATAVFNGSLMNSCANLGSTGEFTQPDVVALNGLYGFFQSWVGSQWSGSFSDAAGWASSDSFWATIDYPDVTGDGRADVCGRSVSGIACGVSVSAAAGASFAPPTQWSAEFSNAGNWHTNESYWGTVRFPDVNGDGRADVCGRSASGILCALSNGATGFTASSLWTAGYSDAGGWGSAKYYWGTIQYPDLNADGKADVCGRSGAGVMCALSTGTGFGPVTTWTAGYSDAGGWAALESYWGTIRFADLNGDGRDDICGRSGAGIMCALSGGSLFGGVTLWTAGYSDAGGWAANESYWRTIRFPDVSGDGRADVCGRSVSGIACAQSTGGNFTAVSTWTAGFSDADGWAASPAYYRTIEYPEIDGDSRADVCGRNATGIFCASSFGANFGLVAAMTRSFSDAAGWLSNPSLWRTVRYPDIDGTSGADVCSRAPDGITCAK